ncbi:DUF1934 domain-containing protein [Thermoactinomyces sp. DSM 45892]|uniref:DUF1934 domain-containing protein n=1 Tax=Thermoactinomyces sp. DSM 45892 TaxID=1882753 RepID=UPI0008962B6B|nr:DUF1934 domain-containing protein [Thermoactinomyces sp. DSM 45892]SDY38886.1 Uncharacterized beta-barrel protein YwiB, DUF1934 family [Thermoactinomyces sp. DSM 45892]
MSQKQKREVRVRVVSIIYSDPVAEPERIEQEMPGSFEESWTDWKIRYKENPGTSEEIATMVRAGEDQLVIIRRGGISYRQVYRPDDVTVSTMTTPGGQMEMEVHTHQYRREMGQGSGKIEFSFELSMSGQSLGLYELTIDWLEG